MFAEHQAAVVINAHGTVLIRTAVLLMVQTTTQTRTSAAVSQQNHGWQMRTAYAQQTRVEGGTQSPSFALTSASI